MWSNHFTISILIEKSLMKKKKTFIPWDVVVLFQRIAFSSLQLCCCLAIALGNGYVALRNGLVIE